MEVAENPIAIREESSETPWEDTCIKGLIGICRRDVVSVLLRLPRETLDAGQKRRIKLISDYHNEKDSEDDSSSYTEGRRSRGRPRKIRSSTGSGRDRGRPKKARASVESAGSITPKKTWVGQLCDVDSVELPEELKALIDSMHEGKTAVPHFLKAEDYPPVFERVRKLFYMISIADFAAALQGTDKPRWSKDLQEMMEEKLNDLADEWRTDVQAKLRDTILNDHDHIQPGLKMAFNLRSFCEQQGTGSIFHLCKEFTDEFLMRVTTQGTTFNGSKDALRKLQLGEKAKASGADTLAETIRDYMLREIWGVNDKTGEV